MIGLVPFDTRDRTIRCSASDGAFFWQWRHAGGRPGGAACFFPPPRRLSPAAGAAGGPPAFEAGEVNVALWDTVMYSMATVAEPERVIAKKEAVLAAFAALAGDPKFRRLLVSQPKAVVARAEAWDRVLKATIGA